mmetsp:Transcript_21255/g.72390  ORF Transcript_21255/g.72390 Transcript_21255/m.72390 type:complete len:254 (-) Transcript_21255:1834-2595(-)
MRTLKGRPVKCLMYNRKGCSSLSGNPETAPYRNSPAPPSQAADIRRGFRSCALVGNGPGLTRRGNGAAIDSHDAVFRFNGLRKQEPGWLEFTGEKSTFRIMNKKRLEVLILKKFQPSQGEDWLVWNYMSFPLLRRGVSLNKRSYVFSPAVLKYTVDGYFAVRKDLQRLGISNNVCPTNLNSGIHAVFLAMQMCESVNIFGFSYLPEQLSVRSDAISPRKSPHHDWGFDTYVLRLLHLAGMVNLCTTPKLPGEE